MALFPGDTLDDDRLLSSSRSAAPVGRTDAASPDATGVQVGPTPGPLGRFDRGDPDHPAFRLAHRHPPGQSIVNFTESEVETIFGNWRLPKDKDRHRNEGR